MKGKREEGEAALLFIKKTLLLIYMNWINWLVKFIVRLTCVEVPLGGLKVLAEGVLYQVFEHVFFSFSIDSISKIVEVKSCTSPMFYLLDLVALLYL